MAVLNNQMVEFVKNCWNILEIYIRVTMLFNRRWRVPPATTARAISASQTFNAETWHRRDKAQVHAVKRSSSQDRGVDLGPWLTSSCRNQSPDDPALMLLQELRN